MDILAPCSACGYDLAGLGRQNDEVRCPECGAAQTIVEFHVRPLPPWRVRWWSLSWPAHMMCAVCAVTTLLALAADVFIFLTLVLAPLAVLAGIAGPLVLAGVLAQRAEPPGPRRGRLETRLVLIGLALNAVFGTAWLAIGLVLARLVVLASF